MIIAYDVVLTEEVHLTSPFPPGARFVRLATAVLAFVKLVRQTPFRKGEGTSVILDRAERVPSNYPGITPFL